MRRWLTVELALFLTMSANTGLAQSLPPLETKTLDEQPVVIPGVGRTRPLLLFIGFSHKSDEDFKKWTDEARTPFVTDARVDYYELADLQSAPALIRKMIVHGMRGSVKEPRRAHLAPFAQHDTEWKMLVNFADPDVIYVVLADPKGNVVWQSRGPATEAKAQELESVLTKLSGESSSAPSVPGHPATRAPAQGLKQRSAKIFTSFWRF
jgi:hypothetical protein